MVEKLRDLRKIVLSQAIHSGDDEARALSDRTAIANRLEAKVFISLHANASTHRSVTGAETFYMSLDGASDAASAALAAIEAVRMAVRYMTPVMLLTDGFLANASEPWLIPDVDETPASGLADPAAVVRDLAERKARAAADRAPAARAPLAAALVLAQTYRPGEVDSRTDRSTFARRRSWAPTGGPNATASGWRQPARSEHPAYSTLQRSWNQRLALDSQRPVTRV